MRGKYRSWLLTAAALLVWAAGSPAQVDDETCGECHGDPEMVDDAGRSLYMRKT